MRLFDLHCDTLYRAVTEGKDFNSPDLHVSVDRAKGLENWVQCFAVWIPDDISGDEAEKLFDNAYIILQRKCTEFNLQLCSDFSQLNDKNSKKCFFTVENGKILQGNIEKIQKLKACNVKILTLTWNGGNEIGTGALTAQKSGLTHFGVEAVKELEKNSIIVDVSHASEKTFYDVAEIASKPFIATHSNSKKITNHPRNLTDEQFEIIKNRGGIVGINFYRGFLNKNEGKAGIKDIIKHTEHFLSLGGESCLSIGSDFDGCDLPGDVRGIDSIPEIYEEFLRLNYNEEILQKIFYKNAFKFCENFDN